MNLLEQKARYVKLSKEFLVTLAEDERLTKKDYKVLLYLLTKLDDKNFIRLPQKKVCIDLFLEKSVVSKSFRNLEMFHIIEVGTTDDFVKGYRFCQLNRYEEL